MSVQGPADLRLATSQSLTVWSSAAEARLAPSGENASDQTSLSCAPTSQAQAATSRHADESRPSPGIAHPVCGRIQRLARVDYSLHRRRRIRPVATSRKIEPNGQWKKASVRPSAENAGMPHGSSNRRSPLEAHPPRRRARSLHHATSSRVKPEKPRSRERRNSKWRTDLHNAHTFLVEERHAGPLVSHRDRFSVVEQDQLLARVSKPW